MARQPLKKRTIVPGIYTDAWTHDGDKGDTIGSRPKLGVSVGQGINLDAWGKQKVTADFSLYHGLFTFNVPLAYWKECVNGVELPTLAHSSSVNGKLHLTSNGTLNDEVVLDTFRNPRYQPNRGLLYSSSMFLPNATNEGVRDWGFFTEESGIFFRLRGDGSNWLLYITVRTTVDAVTTDTEHDITKLVPEGYDPEKGNIYDLQAQWRGVGNITGYIGDELSGFSERVHTVSNLNKLTELSCFNPATPIAFCCTNKGDEVVIECGCVDLTSEGGNLDRGFYGSVGITNDAGQVAINGFNVPVLICKNMKLLGVHRNTRDMVALLATAYSDQRSLIRVWATRDESAITLNDQSWISFRDGNIEFLEYNNPSVTTPITFDTAKAELIFTTRVNMDDSYATSALFEGRTEIFQSPGDIFIFTMHRENGGNANVGVTYEFAEEI